MTTETRLKPCPFCGSKDITYGKTNNMGDYDQWVAICVCDECKSQSYCWNDRTPAIDKEKLVEWLKEKEMECDRVSNIYHTFDEVIKKIESGEFDL